MNFNAIFLNKSQIFSIKIIHPISCIINRNLHQTKEALDIFSNQIEGDKAGTTLRHMIVHLLNPSLEDLQLLYLYEITYQCVDPRQNDLKSIMGAMKSMSQKDIISIFGRFGDDIFRVIHKT